MRRQATFLAAVLVALCSGGVCGAEGVTATRGGVTVWVGDAAFRGTMDAFQKGTWRQVAAEALPQEAGGHLAVATNSLLVALDSGSGRLGVYTRHSGELTLRGEVSVPAVAGRFRIAADAKTQGLAVEAISAEGEAGPQYTLAFAGDGILEIRPGAWNSLTVSSRMKYAVVPSLVGTDLLYRADVRPMLDRLYVPSMNMIVGLLEGEGGVMVGVWPPGKQTASLERKPGGGSQAFEGFSLDMAGESFYLAYLERPGIWHAEPLRAEYLEQDTPIAWKRPFEAKWIGRFYIESDSYHFPFYFRYEKMKLWGRCVRGWFNYPFWFEGDKSIVHFEKKFPPKGEMLIYYLQGQSGNTDIASPMAVIEKALGQQTAARLLDFEGVDQRLLLKHGNAVCAMTRKIEEAFASGSEVKRRAEVEAFADDVATFIRLIRERVFEFRDFAAQTKALLAEQQKADPALADDLKGVDELLDEIVQRAQEELPKSSLEEVRQWTGAIKAACAEVRPENLATVKKMGQQCRSVAGTQDDLDRDLSILAIRVMEEAAAVGVKSPAHVRLAEQVIARTRAVLRRPTWWEPSRIYLPKSDPGAP